MEFEWGVRDNDSGHIHTGFTDEQDAKDWADPNVGNPNWGNWTVVKRPVVPWEEVN